MLEQVYLGCMINLSLNQNFNLLKRERITVLDGCLRDHSIQTLGQVPVYVSAVTGVCMIF